MLTPCEETHRVERSSLASYSQIAPRGSIEFTTRRLLTMLQLHHLVGLGEGRLGPGAVAHLPVEDDVVLDVVVRPAARPAGPPRRCRRCAGGPRSRPRSARRRPWPAPASRPPPAPPDRRHGARGPWPASAAACRRAGVPSRFSSGTRQGTSPKPAFFTSSPVSTSSTPGAFWAAAVSMLLDVGMGVRRAQHVGAGRRRAELGVVGVAPAARQQAGILDPANRLSDAELRHEFLRLPGG